jgi:hypothetical protein
MNYRSVRYLLLVALVGATSGLAQSPDLNQLKTKLQQLEQMMQELKSQIAAVEQPQAPLAQTAATAQEKPSSVPTPQVPVEHMGDATRLRDVASMNPDSAGRINNEPMDRALRGYFRLTAPGP